MAIRTGGAVIIPAITQAIVRLIIYRHNQSGEVFQKDLGPQTPELVKARRHLVARRIASS
jgi:hypothetical protein